MSRAIKRKHLVAENVQDDYSPPTGKQQIVKVLGSRGRNLHEVRAEDGGTFLVSIPCKFRKHIWIVRGQFVLVEPIEEGNKVKAEIVKVLTKVHLKYFKKDGVWPAAFDEPEAEERSKDDDLFVNRNRFSDDDEDEEKDSDADTD